MKISPATWPACATLALCAPAQAAFILPEPNVLAPWQYGDVDVFPLHLLETCAGANDPRCIPFPLDQAATLAQFPVKATNGATKDKLVILNSDSAGTLSNYDGGSGPFSPGSLATTAVDNPFITPSGSGAGRDSFDTTAANEPFGEIEGDTGITPDFIGDLAGRWDASLASLSTYLRRDDADTDNDGEFFLFLNNNQEGNDPGEYEYYWAQFRVLEITPLGGVGSEIACWELNSAFNTGGTGCGTGSPVFDPNPTSGNPLPGGDYMASLGRFCVSALDGSRYNFTAANAGDCLAGDYFVSNNLGNSDAEFALYLPALQENLDAWAELGYFLSIDWRMRGLDDGGEEMWVCRDCLLDPPEPPNPPDPPNPPIPPEPPIPPDPPNPAPAPGVLGLLAAGLPGLAAWRRRGARGRQCMR